MYEVALCEDNPIDEAEILNILDDYEEHANEDFRVKCFPDAENLTLSILSGGYRPDIIFTEIVLPGMSGIDAVRKIREENLSCIVIFIISPCDCHEYALEAWRLKASQYLIKPLTYEKIFETLNDILPQRDYLFIKLKRCLRKIPFRDILYCETRGKFQAVITRSEEILVRITAHNMKKIFPCPRNCNFTDLGLTYLLNLDNVNMLIDGRVIFDGGKELILSRRRFQKVSRELMGMSAKKNLPRD